MATPEFDLNDIKRRMQGAVASLSKDLGSLRTGRATPSLVDPIQVDAYGSMMPMAQVATVSVPEPRLLSISVWDRSMVTRRRSANPTLASIRRPRGRPSGSASPR
jgi:ribosome recycling factor